MPHPLLPDLPLALETERPLLGALLKSQTQLRQLLAHVPWVTGNQTPHRSTPAPMQKATKRWLFC